MKSRKHEPETTLRALIRDAIERDARSLPRIAEAAGLDKAQVWRYCTGRRDVVSCAVDKLVAALGFRVRLVRAGKGR